MSLVVAPGDLPELGAAVAVEREETVVEVRVATSVARVGDEGVVSLSRHRRRAPVAREGYQQACDEQRDEQCRIAEVQPLRRRHASLSPGQTGRQQPTHYCGGKHRHGKTLPIVRCCADRGGFVGQRTRTGCDQNRHRRGNGGESERRHELKPAPLKGDERDEADGERDPRRPAVREVDGRQQDRQR